MLKGINSFKEHFANYKDKYVVIGGTACSLLMSDTGIEFRATRDIDMIILIENQPNDFINKFWEYIKLGRYTNGSKSTGNPCFYRFYNPQEPNFPDMIELFSRHPEYNLIEDTHLTPLHFADDISSLSAILLDDDYYNFMHQGIIEVQGVSTLNAACLIPFKAKAYLDLQLRKSEGYSIDDRDIRKHKNDVYRLFTLLIPTERLILAGSIRNDMERFLSTVSDDRIDLKQIGVNIESLEELLSLLRRYYLG